jgi:hypothetical protein
MEANPVSDSHLVCFLLKLSVRVEPEQIRQFGATATHLISEAERLSCAAPLPRLTKRASVAGVGTSELLGNRPN